MFRRWAYWGGIGIDFVEFVKKSIR